MKNQSRTVPYLFIGDIKTKGIVTQFSLNHSNKQYQLDAYNIFERLYKSNYHLNQRNQIKANAEGDYYFVVTEPSLFFLVYTKNDCSPNHVFKLIDSIIQEHIPLMTNDKGELNAQGRQALKTVIEKWQTEPQFDKISEIQEAVDSIKIDMKENIEKVVNNIDDLDDLQNKSDKLKETGSMFRNDARTLQRVTWSKNCKLIVIIVFIVIILLLIIILPIVLKKKK